MFPDFVLEKIFAKREIQSFPVETQSIIIHAIEEVLEEVKRDDTES